VSTVLELEARCFIPWYQGISKIYQMAPKFGENSDNLAITTNDQWKQELQSLLDTGSEMNSMYSLVFLHCYCYMRYPLKHTQ